MEVRLQKYMADCGVASRRKCETMIEEGRVRVNGRVVSELGSKIDPQYDKVSVDKLLIRPSVNQVYIALNKPSGYVCTAQDQFDRKIVTDLIDIKERIVPVGRLDYNSEGLLFLTNDGDFTYRVTHPKNKIQKKYYVQVNGIPTEDEIAQMVSGVTIDDFNTKGTMIQYVKTNGNTAHYRVTISQGKNRQIRKMFEHFGYTVKKLKRVAIGNIRLGQLRTGQWRFLTKEEVENFK